MVIMEFTITQSDSGKAGPNHSESLAVQLETPSHATAHLQPHVSNEEEETSRSSRANDNDSLRQSGTTSRQSNASSRRSTASNTPSVTLTNSSSVMPNLPPVPPFLATKASSFQATATEMTASTLSSTDNHDVLANLELTKNRLENLRTELHAQEKEVHALEDAQSHQQIRISLEHQFSDQVFLLKSRNKELKKTILDLRERIQMADIERSKQASKLQVAKDRENRSREREAKLNDELALARQYIEHLQRDMQRRECYCNYTNSTSDKPSTTIHNQHISLPRPLTQSQHQQLERAESWEPNWHGPPLIYVDGPWQPSTDKKDRARSRSRPKFARARSAVSSITEYNVVQDSKGENKLRQVTTRVGPLSGLAKLL